ncbi:MAG: prolipoprotein diacylglyceryl transferase [Candidatus Omnitrophica bacterium]|nr:prolipoprotein diacylglyceryl transferase [Candidatus Omnitrophota bacterium]
MHPILLHLGPLTLYSYGAMLVLGFLTTTWLACRFARQVPAASVAITAEQVVDFSCFALLGGIVGGRIFYVILRWEEFARDPLEIVALWHGGLVWYGGFIGGIMAGWLYVRAQRLDFLRVLDQFMPFVALGHAIGRVGCFFNGCCYGKTTTLWCGVWFPGHEQAVLPTQLFEAGGLLVLFLILRRLQSPSNLRSPGTVFGAYLIGYGLLRCVIEWFRGDQTVWWMGLTLQQLISACLVVCGLALWWGARWRAPRTTRRA